MSNKIIPKVGLGVLLAITFLSGMVLVSTKASADASGTVNISVTVPSVCSLALVDGANNEKTISNTITPGTRDTIGTASFKAICNDPEGLAVYAIGYTGNTHGNTDLEANDDSGNTIETGYTASNPTDSEWYMSLAAIAGDYAPIIADGANNTQDFTNPHAIPSTYAKVAYRNSNTDVDGDGYTATGANFTATFGAYIAPSQPSGIYEGKVKFTLVHPSAHNAPASRPAMLDTGQIVNAKMKTLANGTSKTYTDYDSLIKAINVADTLPANFEPTEANTVSSSASEHPIYIFFDNTNNAGIMNFYTEGDRIFLPTDSSYMFNAINFLADLLDIADWDSSNVTNMYYMFYTTGVAANTAFSLDLSSWDTSNVTNMSYMFTAAGYNATTWSIGDLSGWDTSKVTEMSAMFSSAGYNATTWSIGDLSDWDTSKVTTMASMFYYAGRSATTWSIGDLSGWDTSKVTNMQQMFSCAGRSATTWSIGDLSGWETSSVTNMGSMFAEAGRNATTWSIGDLSDWDTSSVTNMYQMFSSAGYSTTTFSIDLSGWDTSKVTDMNTMFSNAGYNATTWSVIIPTTNGNNINNTTSRMYGKTTSTYASPDSGKTFTLVP